MRYLGFCGLLAGIVGAGVAQPVRTPDGMLWAGTTFSIRAVATVNNQSVSLSNQADVSVGAVIQWRVLLETPPAQTVPGSEGWFTLLLTNRSNAVDALQLRLKSAESADVSPWNFALLEQREDGSGFNNGNLLTGATSPLMPGETRRLFLRARPPGNRNTDGAFLNWLGISQRQASLTYQRDLAVGVEVNRWTHTATSTPPNHRIVGEPYLIQGRLYWLSWDGQVLRLYRTPNPLSTSVTFSNNVSTEARISMPAPASKAILIGNRWYLLTQSGRVVFFNLAQAQGGASIAAQSLNLPDGVSPEPNLPFIQVGDHLCFVDRQSRIWLVHTGTHLFTEVVAFSNQPVTALSGLYESVFAVGRSDGRIDIYMGSIPILQGLRMPDATRQPVAFIGFSDPFLLVIAGNTLGVYRPDNAKWLWYYALDSPAASNPVYDARQGACYVLTQSGQLYGLDLGRGTLLPLYPQPLFNGTTVSRAVLGCLARADRDVSYLYLQAQLTDGSVQTMLITGINPLNRFVNTQIPVNASIGSCWLFTGEQSRDLALCWAPSGAGSNGVCGAIYGFQLQ
ncbi:MAG: hypothetical protein N2651_07240 [Fimbriimonadales bacterium]|nr:hypothetical protein [Fimbriimonadales bacterium]